MKEKILKKIYIKDLFLEFIKKIDLKIFYLSSILAFLFLFIHIDFVTYNLKHESLFSYLFKNIDLNILDVIFYNYFSSLSILYIYIYAFRINIFGNIFIFITILLYFIDTYLFNLNGLNVFRIGLNDTLIHSFILSLKETNYLMSFFETYKNEIIFQILIPTIITFIIAYILKKIIFNDVFIFTKKDLVILITSLFYFNYLLFSTSQQAPFFIKSYYTIMDYIYTNVLLNQERKELYIKPTKKGIHNIIYIMDESINYNAKENTFFFLEKYKNNIFDFNLSYSYDNCSFPSRAKNFIGFDTTKHKNNDISIQPTFFQYAKNANYKTFILDNQESFLFNGLNAKDMKWIDSYQFFTQENLIFRDLNRIENIQKILNENNNEKKFIYLKKYGAHFNYINNYPFEKITLFGNINIDNSTNEKNLKNSYLNNVYWNTNLFFEKLLPLLNDNTVVLYTSDHGELNYYDEETKKFLKGHCFEHKDVKKVPIFIFSKNSEIIKNLYKNNKIDEDKIRNHKDLYTLLLNYFGY